VLGSEVRGTSVVTRHFRWWLAPPSRCLMRARAEPSRHPKHD